MRRTIAILLAAACLAAGCSTSGEMIYTGRIDNDPSVVRAPEATGQTRDDRSRVTTSTRSNRVDIPVYEFAHVKCRSDGYVRTSLDRYDARFGRLGLDSKRSTEGADHVATLNKSLYSFVRNGASLGRATTDYRGIDGRQYVFTRTAGENSRAVSVDTRSALEAGESEPGAVRMRRGFNGSTTRDGLSAAHGSEGLEQLFGDRIIGLHLWKYADRDLAAEDVVITYTLVYYNTNNYDPGPTEISEPVALLTDYIDKSATLPKEGVSVELLARKDGSHILRWTFPKGIKAGETNKMSYKVRVRLQKRYESGEQPATPSTPPFRNP